MDLCYNTFMSNQNENTGRETGNLSVFQMSFLTILRMAIGWHFLYEGVIKLYIPDWSAASYLEHSKWLFSGFFNAIVANPSAMHIVDLLNIWGLILIGLGLIVGCFTRLASIAGAFLLLLYYVANPPFITGWGAPPTEGHYLIINKTLIEFIAVCVLAAVPTGSFFGLDVLVKKLLAKFKSKKNEQTADVETAAIISRRELIRGLGSLPVLGAFGLTFLRKHGSFEEKNLVDAVTSATVKTFNFTSLKELKGQMPHTKIGDLELSKVILGGNLIGGWAHARDLIYVSKLVKAYHHEGKVFETFMLAEKCGINAILTNPSLSPIINKYKDEGIGKINFISDCGGQDLMEMISKSIDGNAQSCYVQGELGDRLVREKKFDVIAKGLEIIRQNGLPAGIGAHRIETIQACVEQGLIPDYWVKTLHHRNYWSTQEGRPECDNVFCRKPQETIDFMEKLEQPWIAFKVLAAGAIQPSEGFEYAFQNGADFICVGMYDFQIVDDTNIALDVLAKDLQRKRPWRA